MTGIKSRFLIIISLVFVITFILALMVMVPRSIAADHEAEETEAEETEAEEVEAEETEAEEVEAEETETDAVEAPNIIGLEVLQAFELLGEEGLVLGVISREFSDPSEADIIIEQSPPFGTAMGMGDSIDIVVGKGPAVEAPNIIGLEVDQALELLEEEGLVLGVVSSEFSDPSEADIILEQSPPFGTDMMSMGDSIDIVVGKGPETLEFDISFGEVTAFGSRGSLFEFKANITFYGEEEKYFEIEEEFLPGWDMDVNPSTNAIDVPILKLKPDSVTGLKVKCRAIVDQEPGEYIFKITLKSVVEGDELERSAEFIGIVKPSGALELTASTERLSTEVWAGKENIYKISVRNTGTAPVEDITLTSSGEPEGWLVEIQENIDKIDVGQEVTVDAVIVPPNRTISGDYNIRFNASSEDGNDSLQVRTMVKTPLIWQIVGIGIIALVIAGIAVIFERLSRR